MILFNIIFWYLAIGILCNHFYKTRFITGKKLPGIVTIVVWPWSVVIAPFILWFLIQRGFITQQEIKKVLKDFDKEPNGQ